MLWPGWSLPLQKFRGYFTSVSDINFQFGDTYFQFTIRVAVCWM
jgi:hypothetical protein